MEKNLTHQLQTSAAVIFNFHSCGAKFNFWETFRNCIAKQKKIRNKIFNDN